VTGGRCLAGEAGLRIGEVKALRWQDVDLVAATITVRQQVRHGIIGSPKGGRRRTVPMTGLLLAALKALSVVRVGYVLRGDDDGRLSDDVATDTLNRIYRRSGVALRSGCWHLLRHSFGTHEALLGVNPWSLQAWMGHGRIDETMLYVHVASNHRRPLPPELVAASEGVADPDQRVLRQLAARADVQTAAEQATNRGHGVDIATRARRTKRVVAAS
jgi:integrase